ncbi:MAG: PEGA domain-containing protein [Bacteroidota bacterium]
MKNNSLFLFIAIIALPSCSGCREDIVVYPDQENTGSVYLSSSPPGASIFLRNSYIEKITPALISNLSEGSYFVSLRLNGYSDTSTVVIIENNKTEYLSIRLKPVQ